MQTNELLYLSQEDVIKAGVTMADVIDALEIAFREKGQGNTEMPPKPGIHPGGDDNFIHAMPAFIPALKSAGIKWVSAFVDNLQKGLPYISGLVILNHAETGLPLSVMDGVWMTAMRTGAATALSARYLARPESSTVGVLGCGVQGRTNLEALTILFPVKTVKAFDTNADAADAYRTDVETRLKVAVEPVKTPREAVTGCDMVVTAGPLLKNPHATIRKGWLDQGAFASLVDFESYWHADALGEVDRFCTDDTPQIEHYQTLGYFKNIPPIHADLGELVTGQKAGRETDEQRTMTANLGLAIDDMAVAPLIYRKAKAKGIGTVLPL
jgi:ornithine cyclodeaminase/alanine dehydrogenase-like protein (mu-crystallin family)